MSAIATQALKFTLYTYQSISIGQSTLALALLDLKPIEIYLKIRIFRLDVWIIGVHAILVFLTTCCVICDSSSFQQYLVGYCLRTGNALSI